jgi:hypothetical protein
MSNVLTYMDLVLRVAIFVEIGVLETEVRSMHGAIAGEADDPTEYLRMLGAIGGDALSPMVTLGAVYGVRAVKVAVTCRYGLRRETP